MSIVTEKSPITALPEHDIFASTSIQTSVESTYDEEIRPIAQLNSGGHYEFLIHNSINECIKLHETTLFLRFRVKLTHKNGTTITQGDWNKVSLVNNFLHSLWSQIDLAIGESQVTTSLQTYPYRAYLETILTSSPTARKTYLTTELFEEEDMSVISNALNATRQNLIKHKTTESVDTSIGAAVEIQGKLHLDLFQQYRSLIGGTKLRLKLVPNRPEFYFNTNDPNILPRIEFEEMYLNIYKTRIS